jgi:hypothetical protein
MGNGLAIVDQLQNIQAHRCASSLTKAWPGKIVHGISYTQLKLSGRGRTCMQPEVSAHCATGGGLV